MKKATFYQKLINKKLMCSACSHYCKLDIGKKGICGVRKNIGGVLYSLVYGLVAAIHLDPIEKKPLYHFMPGSEILSFGTVGCNFRCDFCQNWDMSQVSKIPHRDLFGVEYNPAQIVDFALELGAPSVAYTYNEPGVFIEYAIDTMKIAHKKGLKNVFVSNGYLSKESRMKLTGLLDAVNIDLKSFDDGFYQKVCGARLQPVLDCIEDLYLKRVHLELTTLVIPGYNDSPTELEKIASYIANLDQNIPWHISRFFPSYKMRDVVMTPLKTLKLAEKIGKKQGLKNIYVGNI